MKRNRKLAKEEWISERCAEVERPMLNGKIDQMIGQEITCLKSESS